MNRFYTIMIIPEHGEKVISFRIPRLLFRALLLLFFVGALFAVLLAYDYKQILNQVYENKYLVLENYKLRDQLGVFQLKINTLSNDLQRISIFEKKLRMLTGVGDGKGESKMIPPPEGERPEGDPLGNLTAPGIGAGAHRAIGGSEREIDMKVLEGTKEFIDLRDLYYQQLARDFGIPVDYFYTATWSKLVKKGLVLADQFALFDFRYNALKSSVGKLEVAINELDRFWLDRESVLKSTPSILPSVGWLTSFYGVRQSPYAGRPKIHEGLDLGARTGTPIVASADGVVIYSGHRPGLGKYVQIDHGYGLETVYGHCNRLFVTYGQKVSRGDVIAEVGNTGLSTGPHLHYEVRVNGIAVDPLYFVLE
ncbi:MAG: M23 family metallopeptidase [Oligoflexia bacterium]|nr:M23 family metallopeptidase [Oligoflexia bacterium]MBF0366687.1 M23 family metallopeptidase [Oligoflexia bacterium]